MHFYDNGPCAGRKRESLPGTGRSAMPPTLAFLTSRWPASDAAARRDIPRVALIVALHLAALGLMAWSEVAIVPKAVFLLTWGLINFFWLAVLRRPAVSAALSLVLLVVLILLSRLKYDIIWMTANFLDVMIVNTDTISFLLSVKPDILPKALLALALALPMLALLWWIDSFRVRLRSAVVGFVLCFVGVVSVALAFPQGGWEAFFGDGYVSKFARSGVDAVSELMLHGYMESDATVTERLKTLPEATCAPAAKPPHIILVHDESSFDIRVAPGVKVPTGYGPHFRSFDGKTRHFIAEGAGGPSWYTEYNVLAGLSARSFGRFAYYVTQIAAGRVARGLPTALRRCGYHTFSIYPALGAFMSAKSFQTTAGVQTFVDQGGLGTNRVEPDQFYYDAALKMIERERDKGPMFLFVYLAENHYPWNYRWRPELMPDWKDQGNTSPGVDEYLRRQSMSFHDYAGLLDRLKRKFPSESFLLVRYGDHQPDFASTILEPSLDEAGINRRLMTYDPRYFTTYYAIDAVNYNPRNLSSALETIEGPYLPLIVQEAAGLPLDPSFAEQKKILQRCKGLFYACAGGAEARRFNRLLIDAGLIKGL
jgi:phosphoglycerol transferase MdoB-like AlkP superfamily enzyme